MGMSELVQKIIHLIIDETRSEKGVRHDVEKMAIQFAVHPKTVARIIIVILQAGYRYEEVHSLAELVFVSSLENNRSPEDTVHIVVNNCLFYNYPTAIHDGQARMLRGYEKTLKFALDRLAASFQVMGYQIEDCASDTIRSFANRKKRKA